MLESTDDEQAKEELQDLERLMDQVKVKVHRLANLNLSQEYLREFSSLLSEMARVSQS
jgi:hypothetical protein